MNAVSRNRYQNFSARGIKIHLFKKMVARLAPLLPRAWRFSLLGLPSRTRRAAACQVIADGNIFKITNGICSHLGAHLDAYGAYIPEITLGAGPFIETRFLQKQRMFPTVGVVRGTILSLAMEGQINYYRWIMEVLPRLRFVQQYQATGDYLYCCQEKAFHRDSLHLLGYDLADVVASETNPFVRASEVIAPRLVEENESWIIPWLRDKFLPLAQKRLTNSTPKRIYITRRQATSRRVENEAELLQELTARGFVDVALEDCDWLDQVALFQNAEVIIAPHGAALANLVFSSAGALVIELMGEGYPFTFFPEIARQTQLEHHLVLCQPTEPHQILRSDIKVDVERVVNLLEQRLPPSE